MVFQHQHLLRQQSTTLGLDHHGTKTNHINHYIICSHTTDYLSQWLAAAVPSQGGQIIPYLACNCLKKLDFSLSKADAPPLNQYWLHHPVYP